MSKSSAPFSKLAIASLSISGVSLLSLLIPFEYGGYDIARMCMIIALPLSMGALIFAEGKLRVAAVVVAVIILFGWLGYNYLNEHLFDGY